MTDQPRFLNLVVRAETDLEPTALLDQLGRIEVCMGRQRRGSVRYGPRPIDIDLLLYDDLVLRIGDELEVPHPRMHERAFVLAPLAEIAPDLRHPSLGLTVTQLCDRVGKEGVRRLGLCRGSR
jgi:2-amino-4-hydroxy-6-hydroxymethyldihydropteridine diphosphokinase